MIPFRALSIIVIMAFVAINCGSSGNGSESPRGASGVIKAEEGGTIETDTGISLNIPPNALGEDTEVVVSSVDLARFDNQTSTVGVEDLHVIGAIFEPDGTVLGSPANVRFPLPPDWVADEVPILYETQGSNPEQALPGSTNVVVSGSPGSYFAEITISHFSTKILSRNCHSGTLRRLIEAFESRGCSRDQLFEHVNDAYDGITVDEDKARTSTPRPTQAFINTYFDDFGTFNGNEDVPADKLAQIIGFVQLGQKVVLAFSSNQEWPDRTEPNDFIPSGAFAHTAVLELDQDNEVQMHHTVTHPLIFSGSETGMARLVEDLGGEIHYTYPAEDLNAYRKLQQGVAFEEAVCGDRDCLSDPAENDYGVGIYNPVDGEYSRLWGRISEPRPVAYPSVHIYVERMEGSPLDACETIVPECASPTLTVDISFDPASPEENEWIFFSADISSGEEPFLYNWDFNDGGESTLSSDTHRYASAGFYEVKLRVIDANEACGTATARFEVRDPDQIPDDDVVVYTFANLGCWDAKRIEIGFRDTFERTEYICNFPGGGIDCTIAAEKVEMQGGFATIAAAQAWLCPQFTAWYFHYWCNAHYVIGSTPYMLGAYVGGCDLDDLPQIETP